MRSGARRAEKKEFRPLLFWGGAGGVVDGIDRCQLVYIYTIYYKVERTIMENLIGTDRLTTGNQNPRQNSWIVRTLVVKI